MWAQVELVERLEISQANSDANHDVRERSGRDSCGESRYPVPSQSSLLTACTEYAHYNSLPPLCKPAIDFIPRALLTKESSQNVRLPRFDALFWTGIWNSKPRAVKYGADEAMPIPVLGWREFYSKEKQVWQCSTRSTMTFLMAVDLRNVEPFLLRTVTFTGKVARCL